jgi:hypothetical protein
LIQYSTAFTSWLVVFSMSLMAAHRLREVLHQAQQIGARSRAQGLEFGKAGVRQRDEPGDLDLHAAVHVAVLAHERAQGG